MREDWPADDEAQTAGAILRTSSLSPRASSAVTVQSRYSWMVAILGASTRDVFRPRGGRVCRMRGLLSSNATEAVRGRSASHRDV